jgi:hypothetical protein
MSTHEHCSTKDPGPARFVLPYALLTRTASPS